MPQKKKASKAAPAPAKTLAARQDVPRRASGARLGAAKALLAKSSPVAAKYAAASKTLAGKSALKPVAAKVKRAPSGVIPTLSAEGMATAIGKTDENTSNGVPKNFRNHPDMENFFRFIYENDLRIEALEIIGGIIVNRVNKKSGKKPAEAALALMQ
ncbi:MAG: hypothetical protein HYW49_03140 [Deltaproteobacteria bacterium]|nr:hypothetical protein [Deltaproteobacteria bacterium]